MVHLSFPVLWLSVESCRVVAGGQVEGVENNNTRGVTASSTVALDFQVRLVDHATMHSAAAS
jgi:hypothetical protein